MCVRREAVTHENRRTRTYAQEFGHLGHRRFGLERSPERDQFADLVEDHAV